MANSVKRAAAALALAAGAGALTGCGTVQSRDPVSSTFNAIQSTARSVASGLVPSSAPGAAVATRQIPANVALAQDARGVLYYPPSAENGNQAVLVASTNPQACMQMSVSQRREEALKFQAAAADRQTANSTARVIDYTGRRAAGAVEGGIRSGNMANATRGAMAAAAGGAMQLGTQIYTNAIRNQGVENMQDRAAAQSAELAQACRQAAAQACGSNQACFNNAISTGRMPRPY